MAKLWHFGVGADSLEVLPSEPVDYSGFQPSAVMPSLKPAPQEQLRAGKTSEMAENVPGTYTDCGEQFYQVLNVWDKYLKSYSTLHINNAGNINIEDMAPELFT